MKNSRVFVVMDSVDREGERSIDLSDATRFGELVFLNPPGMLPFDLSDAVLRMRDLLRTYTDDDYLIATGRGSGGDIAKAIAGAFASAPNEGRVTFLRWDRGKYIPTKVNLFEGLDLNLEQPVD